MEDDENAPPSEGKPFKQRSKRLRLKRFSRKAPSIPLGAASLPDPQEYDSVRHIRMSEDFEQGTKGAEEKLWGRFIGAISSGWRQNPRQGQD